jgi:hypothetical protein
MAPAKRDSNRDRFVFGEEAVLGDEAFPTDANLLRGPGVQVANPIRVGSPRRAESQSTGLGVVAEHHGHGLVRFACLPPDVHEQHEGATQHSPPAASVEVQRQPEHAEHQAPWFVTQTEQ